MAIWGNTLIGQDDFRNKAYNDSLARSEAAKEAAIRQAGRMGINPNSGAFMQMLNNAQYEATAGANAAANAADMQWLNAAQDQYNKDRAAEMDQQRINNQSNQWWAQMNAAQQARMADYEHERGMFDEWMKYKNRQNGQNGQNGQNRQNKDEYIYNPKKPFAWKGYMWYKSRNLESPEWRRG